MSNAVTFCNTAAAIREAISRVVAIPGPERAAVADNAIVKILAGCRELDHAAREAAEAERMDATVAAARRSA